MGRQDLAREIVYDSIARLLPTLGRDFTVDVTFDGFETETVRTSMKLVALTEMGQAIMPMIRRDLPRMMEQVTKERGMSHDDVQEQPAG